MKAMGRGIRVLAAALLITLSAASMAVAGNTVSITARVQGRAVMSLGANRLGLKSNLALEASRSYRGGVLVYTLVARP